MRLWTLLVCLMSTITAEAVLPTLVCRDSLDRSVTLEEGIDEYFLDIVEIAFPGSIADITLGINNQSRYLVSISLPKINQEGSEPRNACFFSSLFPKLFQCENKLARPLRFTNLATGERRDIRVTSVQALALESSKFSIVSHPKFSIVSHPRLNRETEFRVEVQIDKALATAKPTVKYVFNVSACQLESAPLSPAR
jgi:hypothetical protein